MFNPTKDGPFGGCSLMSEEGDSKRTPFPKICYISYNDKP